MWGVQNSVGQRTVQGLKGEADQEEAHVRAQLEKDLAGAGPTAEFLNGKLVARNLDGTSLTSDQVNEIQGWLDTIATGKEGKAFLKDVLNGKTSYSKGGLLLGSHGRLDSINISNPPGDTRWTYFDKAAVNLEANKIYDLNASEWFQPSVARALLHEMGHQYFDYKHLAYINFGEGQAYLSPAVRFENRIMTPIDNRVRWCKPENGGC